MPGGSWRTDVCEIAVICAIAPCTFVPGPEKYFDDSQPVHRLGFHVLNVIDRGGDAALGVGHDAVCHVLRRHSRVKPHDRNDWNIDVRKDVGRSAQDCERRQNDDDERHHDECIRTS